MGHLEWDSLILNGTSLGEDEFVGTSSWDAANQRYDLTDVYFLPQPSQGRVVGPGNQLTFDPRAMIGEARGSTSACGANPTPHECAGSGEPGGRNSRVMISRLSLPPSRAVPPEPDL